MDKLSFAVVGMLLIILSLVLVFSVVGADNSTNRAELAVYTEGSIPLSDLIEDIKRNDCDNETVAWMESLGNMRVFFGDGIIVIMNSWDAGKLHSEYVCDAYINQFINCNVLENRSFGDIKYPRDVLLVNNVEYIGEEVIFLQGS